MVIGSMLGAILANLINVQFVNTVYIIIALLALILMFIKVTPSTSHIKFNRLLNYNRWYHRFGIWYCRSLAHLLLFQYYLLYLNYQ